MAEPETHPNGSMERRVARLEQHFVDLQRAMDNQGSELKLLRSQQDSLKELVNSRFSDLSAALDRIGLRIHDMTNLMQGSFAEAAGSPLGRAIKDDLDKLDRKIEDTRQAQLNQQLTLARIDGATGIARFLGFTGLAAGIGAIALVGLRLIGALP